LDLRIHYNFADAEADSQLNSTLSRFVSTLNSVVSTAALIAGQSYEGYLSSSIDVLVSPVPSILLYSLLILFSELGNPSERKEKVFVVFVRNLHHRLAINRGRTGIERPGPKFRWSFWQL
jgi:hypothetical protein